MVFEENFYLDGSWSQLMRNYASRLVSLLLTMVNDWLSERQELEENFHLLACIELHLAILSVNEVVVLLLLALSLLVPEFPLFPIHQLKLGGLNFTVIEIGIGDFDIECMRRVIGIFDSYLLEAQLA